MLTLLSVFSSSTQIVFISIFFFYYYYLFALSLPVSRFPSCKALGPTLASLGVPVPPSPPFPWHFAPVPFPAWLGSVLQTPLGDSQLASNLLRKGEKISTRA